MNDTEKLLRAFIGAQGYKVEECTVNIPTRTISHFDVNNDGLPVFIDSLEPIINYKVTNNNIDYKALLSKYITHVTNSEGVNFISDNYVDSEDFTEEELKHIRGCINEKT